MSSKQINLHRKLSEDDRADLCALVNFFGWREEPTRLEGFKALSKEELVDVLETAEYGCDGWCRKAAGRIRRALLGEAPSVVVRNARRGRGDTGLRVLFQNGTQQRWVFLDLEGAQRIARAVEALEEDAEL